MNLYRQSLPLILVGALAVGALSACAPVVREQGFAITDSNPASAVVGTDTKATIRTKYGTPTTQASFDGNTWYYLSQTTDQFGAYDAHPRKRDMVEISFDPQSEKVKGVKTYTVADGKQIAYSKRETPTIGKELSIWKQALGTLGQTLLPPNATNPGTAPGQPVPKQ